MIDFKQFLTTIAAIFLALAIGVALGAGPLKSTADQQLRASVDQLTKEKEDLRKQVLEGQAERKYANQAVSDMSPTLVAGRLTDRNVVIVILPTADSADADAVSRLVQQAGGTVAGVVDVQAKFADPGQAQFVMDLGDSALGSVPATGIEIPTSSTGYERVGYVLGYALLQREGGPSDASAQAILSAFTDQGLLKTSGDMTRGQSAIVVAGPPATEGTDTEDPKAYVGLSVGLDGVGAGTVMAGPPESAATGGAVNAVRTDDTARRKVSTVDQVQMPVGKVATVLALVQQIAGRSGHYGNVGKTDGTAPKPTG